ncbi:MAG: aldo/keto reductase, partial [Methanobrevibacter sp.]|nr:aldo/keto reductase [Methanobrevibacter sp.]
MDKVHLGKTNLEVNKIGFGALPIQRRNIDDSVEILRKAYDNGIDFYDTARAYSDSEEKIGLALSDVRENIYIASKTMADNVEDFWNELETSLKYLKTDYLDLYQFHNPKTVPKLGDETGLYEAMLEAKDNGQINHIGITFHKYSLAKQAIESGLYETLQ